MYPGYKSSSKLDRYGLQSAILAGFDTLNPKAVTSDELYGCYSKTKEWKNGVLSMIMKN